MTSKSLLQEKGSQTPQLHLATRPNTCTQFHCRVQTQHCMQSPKSPVTFQANQPTNQPTCWCCCCCCGTAAPLPCLAAMRWRSWKAWIRACKEKCAMPQIQCELQWWLHTQPASNRRSSHLISSHLKLEAGTRKVARWRRRNAGGVY